MTRHNAAEAVTGPDANGQSTRRRRPVRGLAVVAILVLAALLALVVLPAARPGGPAALPGLWSTVTALLGVREPEASATRFLMGTYVSVRAWGPGAAPALDAVVDRLEEMDRVLGPDDAGSDVRRTALGAGSPVVVCPDMLTVLELADRIVELSGGAFDPAVGALVALWGFGPDGEAPAGGETDPGPREPPDQPAVERALALTGWHLVDWDRETLTVTLGREGTSLALGGIAKGYAVDEAARLLRAAGVTRAVIDAGGDLYLLGAKPDGHPWRIAVRHPRRDGHLGVLTLGADTAVATSGDYENYFEAGGERYHHILDPATGRPATGCISVTVVAPTAAVADALATAVFVLGPADGLALVELLADVEALVVDREGDIHLTSGMELLFRPAGGESGDG